MKGVLMTLAIIKKISVFFLFGLSFLVHFMYSIFPNDFFIVFFPVNESIWEHMKIIYTTILIYGGLEYFIIRYFKIPIHNYLFSLFVTSFIGIPIYLILFFPFFTRGFHNLSIHLIILFVTYIICSYISYFILTKKNILYHDWICIFFIIIGYIIFGYLTYHPLKNDLFFDPKAEKYGIHDYIIMNEKREHFVL